METKLLKYPLGILRRAPAKVRMQAVVVPQAGEIPGLIKRQNFATWTVFARAPGVDIIFRPEEQNCRSGIYQVVVPVLEGQGKVDEFAMSVQLVARDTQRYARLVSVR